MLLHNIIQALIIYLLNTLYFKQSREVALTGVMDEFM